MRRSPRDLEDPTVEAARKLARTARKGAQKAADLLPGARAATRLAGRLTGSAERAEATRGLTPGTVVFVGTPRDHAPRLSGLRYDADAVERLAIDSPSDIPAAREADGTTWITLDGVHDAQLVEAVGAQLGLPGLLLEDVVNTNQRPKLDLETGGVAFATLSAITYERGALHAEQVSLVWNRDYLLLFTETPTDLFDAVVERVEAARGRIRTSGPDYLAFALLDVVVDGYFVALERLAESIEQLEESIIGNPEPAIQHRLNAMRRELIALRRAVWPVRELAGGLVRAESPLIDADIAPFLRDLYDHVVQVMDTVETQRELLGSLRDLYMTGLSNRMNEVMKVLTIVGTIFIPLSFVTGLYGMNFEYIPELTLDWGYFMAWGLMLTMVVGMLIYFYRKDWI